MFESAELGHSIPKQEFIKREAELREQLLAAQYELLAQKRHQVVVLIGGVDGAGKGETVNLLNEWMDPRHIITHAFGERSDEESERPRMWRFWRALPPKGKIGILFGSWYTDPIVWRVHGQCKSAEFERYLQDINHFERMLVAEGAVVLKFWFHLSKKAQHKRLKSLEKDPKTRWRVTDLDWQRFKQYDDFRAISEVALRETSTGEAPWTIVEGTDSNYRYLTVGEALLTALRDHTVVAEPPPPAQPHVLPKAALDGRNLLNALDFTAALSKKVYEEKLEKYQGRLNLLTRDPKFAGRSLIVVFEGADAAGKGGSIRRITGALDARHYNVIPVAAPNEEERAQPYLWRFWRQLPRKGRVTIFDRSWYGRVLVERVEGFCSESEWVRAYSEINDFEEQLTDANAIVVKFWVTITEDEQLRRFHAREVTPFKAFKITAEDWRNRAKWQDYERAVCDMVERTSTENSPWVLVPANDKYAARIAILRTLCQRVAAAL